ncbi:HEAT repeat domain-containing protein [Candidatus Nitronereus thalassa]|uniref:HEAT repeat domain-containing protein n=1 Tax=Candidatus Nitronereus thalassa TaxID=3020898 RepID=A0ABU3K5D3_9BACT|nr:HEAT repeat domain-containing protein [Candidatus Nitronereus thalassa]MDT7041605.1 HEAT repeat domain-containing protein [Candidatus Nitronereus thalassa]
MKIPSLVLLSCVLGIVFSAPAGGLAWESSSNGRIILVQIPYEAPPEPEFPEIPKATPAPDVLSEAELKRAEALLPLLEGQQELYIMGEFVHLGKPVVPVLVKALKLPGTRLRYNAIETLSMIKSPEAVPNLIETALDLDEMTRVRERALRVSVKLDPIQSIPALQTIVNDKNDTMRRAVAFLSRYVRDTEIPPLLIQLLGDSERYVAVTALESFWRLTRFSGKPHDWQGSTQEQRKQWALEWKDWWETALQNRENSPNSPSEKPIS